MLDGGRTPHRSSGALGDVGRLSGYGIGWVLTVAILAWAGLKLDERFGTTPLLALVGGLMGIGAGFCTLYVRAVVEPANRKKEEPGSGEELR